MTGRRKVAVAAAVVVLAGIAIGGWKAYERSDRLALAAEIEKEMEARKRPAPPPAPPVPEAEDAAPLWKEAYEFMDESALDGVFNALEERDWKEVPETVRIAELANAKAFSLAVEAASRPRCSPMPAGQLGSNKMGGLGTLVEARGRAALHRKDGAAALVCVRTLRAIGRDAPRIPSSEMFAWAYPFYARVTQLSALELLERIARTPALGLEEEALAVAAGPWILREAWDEVTALQREAIDRDYVRILTMGAKEWLKSMGWSDPTIRERVAFFFKGERPEDPIRVPSAAGIRRFRRHLTQLTEAARRRDVDALAPGGPLDKERVLRAKDDAVGLGVPLNPMSTRRAIAVEAQLEVVRAALALQVFEKRRGRPAASWDDLVPAILPSIPLDPGDGKPIRFYVGPGGGAAWSILSEGKWEETREAEERPRLRVEWGTPPKAGDGRK